MGTADKDPGMGGFQTKGLGDVLQCGSTGGADFRVKDMGADPPHGAGLQKLQTQGRKADNGEISKETRRGGMGIPTSISSDVRGRI